MHREGRRDPHHDAARAERGRVREGRRRRSRDRAASGGALKTGPGVTAKTISLGVLTDTSGVFAGLGGPLVEGNQLFWKLQNAKGGVCGRQVELIVKDHGYDPQKGVSALPRDRAERAGDPAAARLAGRRGAAAEHPEGRRADRAGGLAVAADRQPATSW